MVDDLGPGAYHTVFEDLAGIYLEHPGSWRSASTMALSSSDSMPSSHLIVALATAKGPGVPEVIVHAVPTGSSSSSLVRSAGDSSRSCLMCFIPGRLVRQFTKPKADSSRATKATAIAAHASRSNVCPHASRAAR